MELKDKFIGFIDILGFKDLVTKAETGAGITNTQILQLVQLLSGDRTRQSYEKHGPNICPQSRSVRRDLDFVVTQISDSVVFSYEVSPAGVINLISQCWGVVLALVQRGVMCRGYVTRGNIYHAPSQVIGTGYIKAIEGEKKVSVFQHTVDQRGTPFVEIDRDVVAYISSCDDACVREMFSRLVKSGGSFHAIFPIKRLSSNFVLGPDFDPAGARQSNDTLRQFLKRFKDSIRLHVDPANKRAMEKAAHYLQALDEQLEICDKTDRMLDKLTSPFPSKAQHFDHNLSSRQLP